MIITYGPVTFQQVRTVEMAMRRVPDPSGLDELYREVTLGFFSVWSPFATASNARNAAAAPFDPLGLTINTLKSVLTRDRQQLAVKTGDGFTVFQAPLAAPVGGVLPCDPSGGPYVEDCRVTAVEGDVTAIVYLRLRFAYNDSNNDCTSHRWTVRSETDGESYLTTRFVEGRAIFRLDKMLATNPSTVPDQFRRVLFMPPPTGFIRKNVKAIATPDGAQLAYSYEDRQVRLSLGSKSPVTKIEGDATAGVDWPFSEIKGALKHAGKLWNGMWDYVKHGVSGDAATIFAGLIPTAKARAVCRVYGSVNPKADFTSLSNTAIAVCMDRFAPLQVAGRIFVVSCFVTQGVDNEAGPFVRAVMEFLPISDSIDALSALLHPDNVGAMLNKSQDIYHTDGQPLARQTQPDGSINDGNPPLPKSNNSRGLWASFLVAQALIPPGQKAGTVGLPPAPPVDGQPPRQDEGQLA